MKLFDYQTVLPYPLAIVFQQTVDLENAPSWHPYFYRVEQITSGAIGLGSRWRISICYMGFSSTFNLQIVEWQAHQFVRFQGSHIAGMLPEFLIQFTPVDGGTHVHYFLQPKVPRIMQIPMAMFAPIVGRRDLKQYFHELNQQLATV